MKKIILLLCIATGFAACNTKNDQGSPTAAIDGMFMAMKNGNMEDIKKFITKKDVAFMESAEKFAASIDPQAIEKMKAKMTDQFKEKVKNVKYTLKNEKVDGDKATVDAEVTDNGKIDTHTFNLVKEEGAWKISLINSGDGMFNSMKGNMGAGKGDLKKLVDEIERKGGRVIFAEDAIQEQQEKRQIAELARRQEQETQRQQENRQGIEYTINYQR